MTVTQLCEQTHTHCNQLYTRSSWKTKHNSDISWLFSVTDGSNGADNPAKWWGIQKPFVFGLRRSFCASSEHGRSVCICWERAEQSPGCRLDSRKIFPREQQEQQQKKRAV